MRNESGIHPAGPRLLVLPEQVEEKSPGGIIRFSPEERKREELAQTEAVVVAIGAGAWLARDTGGPLYDGTRWCSVGDTIVMTKYAGFMIDGADGKRYRLINDLDVVATKKPQEIEHG